MNELEFQFCKAAFDHVQPDIDAAQSVIEHVSHNPDVSLTQAEAHTLIDYVIWRTRENLDSALKIYFERSNGENGLEFGIKTPNPNYFGCCGFSQIVSGLAFLSLELDVKGAVLQSIDRNAPRYHAFDVLRLNVNDEDAYFLIDPNCLRKGYIELTPDIAHEYLTICFKGNAPFETAEEAFDFMKNPWPHEHIFDPPTVETVLRDGHIFTLKPLEQDKARDLAMKAGGPPLVESLGL